MATQTVASDISSSHLQTAISYDASFPSREGAAARQREAKSSQPARKPRDPGAVVAKPLFKSQFPTQAAFVSALDRTIEKAETLNERYRLLVDEFGRLAGRVPSFNMNSPEGLASATANQKEIDRVRRTLNRTWNRCVEVLEAGPFENVAHRAEVLGLLRTPGSTSSTTAP